MVDTGSLLAHIRRLPHGQAGYKQLVRELGARGSERAALDGLLERLVRQGRLIETRSGHYMLAESQGEYVTGRLSLHPDGYGFVIPDRATDAAGSPRFQGDVYVGRESAASAMHGDRVLVRLRRTEDGRAEGRLVRILTRAHPEVVGLFRCGPHGNYVVPYHERIRENIWIPPGAEKPPPEAARHRIGLSPAAEAVDAASLDGAVVNVELTQFPSLTGKARGRVLEVLGRAGDFGIDVEIVIRKHHLPHRFPSDVIAEAEEVPAIIPAQEISRRRDFRPFDAVTIDGETARDFDDAVWAEKQPGGRFQLHVHIADVSYYVRDDTAIDKEARLRGTSAYFPDRAVPMLPYELTTGICSLNPSVDRLTLSVLLEFDRHGGVLFAELCEGVIRSAQRMTYTDVNLILEGDAGLRERYGPLVARLECMAELASILNRRRHERGSIDFDLPEPVIEFDELGLMTGISRAERNAAHRLIEEFMLAANEAVAARLAQDAGAALYRIHEKPDPRRVMEFEQMAAAFGYSFGLGPVKARDFGFTARHRDHTKKRREIIVPDSELPITSRHYQKLIARIAGKPEERVLSYLMLRSLKQARYSEQNSGHFALASGCYTHFTSPIRRYPDLIVHRLLKSALAAAAPERPREHAPIRSTAAPARSRKEPGGVARDVAGNALRPSAAELQSIAEECSWTERRAADAERELLDWKKARFMEARIGDEFAGLIVSAYRTGLAVELLDLFIEGFIPIETLAGDRYSYRENLRAIVGDKKKRKFAIGDRITVLVDRVEAAERRVYFSWVAS